MTSCSLLLCIHLPPCVANWHLVALRPPDAACNASRSRLAAASIDGCVQHALEGKGRNWAITRNHPCTESAGHLSVAFLLTVAELHQLLLLFVVLRPSF